MPNLIPDSTMPASLTHEFAEPKDYWQLLKPRVMSLVVFSGLAGIVVAPGHLHPILSLVAVLCIAVASGASGAINMWYDRDIDAIMQRTRLRPLPQNRMAPQQVLTFGISLALAAVFVMGVAVNWVAAALLAAAVLFYVFIYTIWLKRRTPQNIVIGGAAGAFPPMIGWAAVTGGVSLESLTLFALIFFWTPPHFWALALYRCQDYTEAKVPMLPVVAGKDVTRRQMLVYTLLLFPLSLLPYFQGLVGKIYLTGATGLSGFFVLAALVVWRSQEDRYARMMFAYSIFYLFALFGLLMIDR